MPCCTRCYEIIREGFTRNMTLRFLNTCRLHLARGSKKTFDDRLEIDVPSSSRGMDTIYKSEELRGPLVGVVQILLQFLVSFFTVLVTQLQLCHIL